MVFESDSTCQLSAKSDVTEKKVWLKCIFYTVLFLEGWDVLNFLCFCVKCQNKWSKCNKK